GVPREALRDPGPGLGLNVNTGYRIVGELAYSSLLIRAERGRHLDGSQHGERNRADQIVGRNPAAAARSVYGHGHPFMVVLYALERSTVMDTRAQALGQCFGKTVVATADSEGRALASDGFVTQQAQRRIRSGPVVPCIAVGDLKLFDFAGRRALAPEQLG